MACLLCVTSSFIRIREATSIAGISFFLKDIAISLLLNVPPNIDDYAIKGAPGFLWLCIRSCFPPFGQRVEGVEVLWLQVRRQRDLLPGENLVPNGRLEKMGSRGTSANQFQPYHCIAHRLSDVAIREWPNCRLLGSCFRGCPSKELAFVFCLSFQIIFILYWSQEPLNWALYVDLVVQCPSAVQRHRMVSMVLAASVHLELVSKGRQTPGVVQHLGSFLVVI